MRSTYFRVRHRSTTSSVDKEVSFRASENSSDSSSNWRRKEDPVVSAVTITVTNVATTTVSVDGDEKSETGQVSGPVQMAIGAPILDDAQIFRHYRSRHWKPHLKLRSGAGDPDTMGAKRIKCRHSYGIILKRDGYSPPQFLVQNRRHSIGLSEMVRSRWEFNQPELIDSLCADMTDSERSDIGDIANFRRLWSEVYADEGKNDFESEYFLLSLKKMTDLIGGHGDADCKSLPGSSSSSDDELDGTTTPPPPDVNGSVVSTQRDTVVAEEPLPQADAVQVDTVQVETWKQICDKQTIHTNKPALEFSKGRRDRKSGETDIECAKRELKEETLIGEDRYDLLDLPPLKEVFIGINGYRYIYVYYLAKMKRGKSDEVFVDKMNKHQMNEVSELHWYPLDKIISLIRPQDYSRIVAIRRACLLFERSPLP